MRETTLTRKTKETSITATLNLDGTGLSNIHTGIPFLNHMLDSFTRHGRFDLNLQVEGDLETGPHHSIEDTGIVLGQVFYSAYGEGRGIRRFGNTIIPMDESRATVAVDISGRPYLVYSATFSGKSIEGMIDPYLIEHFFESFASNARITLHIDAIGKSDHHICEAIFKSTGVALRQAVEIISSVDDVPSTKGVL